MERLDEVIYKLNEVKNLEKNLNSHIEKLDLLEEKLNELIYTKEKIRLFQQKINDLQKRLKTP